LFTGLGIGVLVVERADIVKGVDVKGRIVAVADEYSVCRDAQDYSVTFIISFFHD
jgi:hypothetical protein